MVQNVLQLLMQKNLHCMQNLKIKFLVLNTLQGRIDDFRPVVLHGTQNYEGNFPHLHSVYV